jgi:hypothetical protein
LDIGYDDRPAFLDDPLHYIVTVQERWLRARRARFGDDFRDFSCLGLDENKTATVDLFEEIQDMIQDFLQSLFDGQILCDDMRDPMENLKRFLFRSALVGHENAAILT